MNIATSTNLLSAQFNYQIVRTISLSFNNNKRRFQNVKIDYFQCRFPYTDMFSP